MTPSAPYGLTHVVLFKLHDRSPDNIARTVARLHTLDGNVPTLRALEVGTDVVKSARSYDIALIARFDDLAGLDAYQVHPFHQDVLAYMRTVLDSAVAVDFAA